MLELTDISALPAWLQVLLAACATLVSEDATVLTLSLLLGAGKISGWVYGLGTVGGILLGDVLLYTLGRFATRTRTHFLGYELAPVRQRFSRHKHHIFLWLMLVQALPGLRMPSYLSAGMARYPLLLFVCAKMLATPIWVWLIWQLGEGLLLLLKHHAIWFGCAILGIIWFYRTISRVMRADFPLSWRQKCQLLWAKIAKYRYAEFWPAWLFYLPVFPMILWLTLRHKGRLTLPTTANPALTHGGFVGEAKSEALMLLPQDHPAILPFAMLPAEAHTATRQAAFAEAMQRLSLHYPVILKPEIGQRGVGVALIHNQAHAHAYLERMQHVAVLLQAYASAQHEVGVFYLRAPGNQASKIFSITEKIFPHVVGNDTDNLASLILADRRARYIAPLYYARFAGRLDEVPKEGQRIKLVESGNHAQGCVFLDGTQRLYSPTLHQALDALLAGCQGIHFTRLDLRYTDEAALKAGKFTVIELNGAGAEATHIYDPSLPILRVYRTLYTQYRTLFAYGATNHANGASRSTLRTILRAWFRAMKEAKKANISP